MNRRGFVSGLLAMPAIIRTPGLLMAIKAPVAPWIITNQTPAEWLEDMMREAIEQALVCGKASPWVTANEPVKVIKLKFLDGELLS